MGYKDIEKAGFAFALERKVLNNLASFVNQNEADALAIRQSYGKPLDTVTDAEIQALAGDGVTLSQPVIDDIHKGLEVLQAIIDTVKPLRDSLPANDF